MPQEKKTFDCVELKNRIQAEIARENDGLTADERRKRIRHELETSDDPVARTRRSPASREMTVH
ncbi:MAG: hypothetical protein KJ057_01235 [Phycisphaerae bacterium]|nr:MAG: hypothetical protein EDS66_05765 [Planctomycetota bacterium]KAB2939465.1 MAG: hypothetical protein F9K17_15080 [Phycisphaerae bacterium]MBE7455819.1 hypothetical protein [Planctomycetia bacterium]MCK6463454.1 hypothetical protein [Phycisphaerae bacterium]MCL4717077.1 hypothetical protein [Phycisphaerae bacterium]